MRRYELMLLFRPDLEDDKLQSAVEKVTRAIVNAGGTLTKVSPWGKRRMAYEIQHFREASYFLLHFDIAPSAIRELERGMMISEEILRHLVTLLVDHGTSISEEDIPPAAVPAAEREDDADGDDEADEVAAADEVDDGAGDAGEDEQAAIGDDDATDDDADAGQEAVDATMDAGQDEEQAASA
jgi:small subunit ribosomal protein S6